MLSNLFNAFNEVQRCHKIVIPDIIRDKIIIYYIGFGTPTTNLLKYHLTEMGQSSFENMDDFTLWRHIVLNRGGNISMKSNRAGGAHGWGAYYELERAYVSSALCDLSSVVKRAKQYTWKDHLQLKFMLIISKLTDRPEPIFGTPTACIIQRFFRNYNNKIENEIDLRSLNLRSLNLRSLNLRKVRKVRRIKK
jgi:hypothetical protein